MIYSLNFIIQNDIPHPAIHCVVPRSKIFATRKVVAHREIWSADEKKPMRKASVFL
jgi:hypothetical protein